MVFIPNEVKVRVGIRQGCVYNFSPKNGVPNHYFIVLNKEPKKDGEIYLASFTSKKDSVLNYIRYHNFDIKTFVEIKENECPFLPKAKESCINCNLVRKLDMSKLIELINVSNGSCDYPIIPDSLIIRIIEGVKLSTMVAKNIKESL